MNDIKAKNLLDEWYIAIRDHQDDKVMKLKEEVEEWYARGDGVEFKKLFQLMQIRFYLMMKDYQNVFNWFNELGPESDIPENAKYYYHLFNGIFMLDNGRYQESLSSFQKAGSFLNDSFLPSETAEYKYWLSHVYFRVGDNSKSIKNALDGFELYQKEHNEQGAALCKNLLGLNSTVLRQFRNAEMHYQYVKRFAEKYDHRKCKCMIYLNLGDLFSDLNLPYSAIEYLKKAEEYTQKETYNHRIRISYLLAKQYFAVQNLDQARLVINQGLNLVLDQNNKEFEHLFKLLKAKYLPETTDVEQVYLSGLDYFNSMQSWSRVWEHSEDLASYYQKQNRYPEAVKYYDLSVQARKTMEIEIFQNHLKEFQTL